MGEGEGGERGGSGGDDDGSGRRATQGALRQGALVGCPLWATLGSRALLPKAPLGGGEALLTVDGVGEDEARRGDLLVRLARVLIRGVSKRSSPGMQARLRRETAPLAQGCGSEQRAGAAEARRARHPRDGRGRGDLADCPQWVGAAGAGGSWVAASAGAHRPFHSRYLGTGSCRNSTGRERGRPQGGGVLSPAVLGLIRSSSRHERDSHSSAGLTPSSSRYWMTHGSPRTSWARRTCGGSPLRVVEQRAQMAWESLRWERRRRMSCSMASGRSGITFLGPASRKLERS